MASLGLQNVADVLKYQANIRIQQDGILGSGMSMQGISGENVKILIDGVPVIGRQNGNIDLSQLNIYNVERIEVVEGPLSVQYGTNALAGTINIITKKTPKKSLDFQGSTYSESVGHFNANGMIGWQNEQQSIMFSGGRNFFSGWSAIDTSRFKEWKPKIQYFADAHYHFHVCSCQVSSLQLFSKRRVLCTCGRDQHRSQNNSEYHFHGNPPVSKIGVKARLTAP